MSDRTGPLFRILTTCAALGAVLLALGSPALAQETRATVTGIVKDAQGAVVPGVTVTVVNTATGVSTEDVTNEAGVFNIQMAGHVPRPQGNLARISK